MFLLGRGGTRRRCSRQLRRLRLVALLIVGPLRPTRPLLLLWSARTTALRATGAAALAGLTAPCPISAARATVRLSRTASMSLNVLTARLHLRKFWQVGANGNRLAQQTLNRLQPRPLLVIAQRDRLARHARPAGTADAMHVGFGLVW